MSAAVQQALFSVMSGDATLTGALSDAWTDDAGAIVAIFSDTPQENADDAAFYPFVSFGEGTHTPWDDKGINGGNSVEIINVWSRSNDVIEAKQIAARIKTLLHNQPLNITGENHIVTIVEQTVISKDPDGHTRRAMMMVRVKYH